MDACGDEDETEIEDEGFGHGDISYTQQGDVRRDLMDIWARLLVKGLSMM